MTVEQKKELCAMRFQNCGMGEIADKFGVTRQAISVYLRRVIKKNNITVQLDERGCARKPNTSLERAQEIFLLISEENKTGITEELKKRGIKPKEVQEVMSYLVGQKKRLPASRNYPFLAKWLDERGLTMSWLAEECGLTHHAIYCYLTDKRCMNYMAATKISKVTGFSIYQLLHKV